MEDLAWPQGSQHAPFGWFFLCPELMGKNRNKLLIRKQCLSDKANHRRHEAPLCGGYGLLYRDKQPDLVTKKPEYRFKIRLSLNLQRFIRHQPLSDKCIPIPQVCRLRKRKGDRSSNGDETAFDHEDNWIPDTPEWKQFASKKFLGSYLDLIVQQVEEDFERACPDQTASDNSTPDDPHNVTFSRDEEIYSLSKVETIWEFPSDHSMLDVFEIGKMLLHLKRQSGTAKLHSFGAKEAQRILNTPCFLIPVAEGVHLRLYAKTNKRIRFELIQSNLMKQRSDLQKEAEVPTEIVEQSWDHIPHIVQALRVRAAKHMNQIMKELRKGRTPIEKSYSAVHLLAEIVASVPSCLSSKERFSRLQTLMVWVCFQRGYRGSIKKSPYAAALRQLENRGVLQFERTRQYYILSEAYVNAADSLTKATGEPLLQIFGMHWGGYTIGEDGKSVVRLRN